MLLGTGFFNSNNYDKVRSSYSPLVTEEVRKLFSEKKHLQIAEVGAGSGNFTDVIIKAGLDITLTASFATGEVYYSNVMDNLMSQIYYNPNLLD